MVRLERVVALVSTPGPTGSSSSIMPFAFVHRGFRKNPLKITFYPMPGYRFPEENSKTLIDVVSPLNSLRVVLGYPFHTVALTDGIPRPVSNFHMEKVLKELSPQEILKVAGLESGAVEVLTIEDEDLRKYFGDGVVRITLKKVEAHDRSLASIIDALAGFSRYNIYAQLPSLVVVGGKPAGFLSVLVPYIYFYTTGNLEANVVSGLVSLEDFDLAVPVFSFEPKVYGDILSTVTTSRLRSMRERFRKLIESLARPESEASPF